MPESSQAPPVLAWGPWARNVVCGARRGDTDALRRHLVYSNAAIIGFFLLLIAVIVAVAVALNLE